MVQSGHDHSKKVENLRMDIFTSNTSKDWPVCVQKMIELKQYIEDVLKVDLAFEKDETSHLYQTISRQIKRGESMLNEQCTEISEKYTELLKFAYELRR